MGRYRILQLSDVSGPVQLLRTMSRILPVTILEGGS